GAGDVRFVADRVCGGDDFRDRRSHLSLHAVAGAAAHAAILQCGVGALSVREELSPLYLADPEGVVDRYLRPDFYPEAVAGPVGRASDDFLGRDRLAAGDGAADIRLDSLHAGRAGSLQSVVFRHPDP